MQLSALANRSRSSIDGREIHYVSLSFTAPDLESRRQRQAVNVGLVLDRSGSMAGRKLVLARTAVDTGLSMLRAEDRFALVVFDDRIDLLAASQHAHDDARRKALQRLAHVEARGSTNLGEGWLRGASEIEPHRNPACLTRVIIATDGMANHGEIDPERLIEWARMLHAKGITTSTIGIGIDFQEDLLQGISDAGGGHAYHAEKPEQLVDQLASELGESVEVTLRQPVIDVTFPEGVSVELLDAYPVTPRTGGLEVAPGDLTARQIVELMFEVTLPAGALGDSIALGFALRAGGGPGAIAHAETRWSFATPEAAASAPRIPEVEVRAAELIEARAREESLNLNRQGRYEDAEARFAAGARKLCALSAENAGVARVAQVMAGAGAALGAKMSAVDMKSQYREFTLLRRGRAADGKARQEPK